MTKTKLFTVLLALVATLAVSSTAMAQGGGASCAKILDFGQTLTYDTNDQPLLRTSFTVYNGCVDHEKAGSVGLDYSNSVSAYTGRSFWGFGYGPFSWSSLPSVATPGVTYTLKLTVYTPGGKIADQRTINTTVPVTIAPAA